MKPLMTSETTSHITRKEIYQLITGYICPFNSKGQQLFKYHLFEHKKSQHSACPLSAIMGFVWLAQIQLFLSTTLIHIGVAWTSSMGLNL